MTSPEAPIIHGAISCSTLEIGAQLTIGDSAAITGIDATLEANSTNPISSTAFQAGISAINAPAVSAFMVEATRDGTPTPAAVGAVVFEQAPTTINTFTTAVPTPGLDAASKTGIVLPASGTYAISAIAHAAVSANDVSASFVAAPAGGGAVVVLHAASAPTLLQMSGTFYLQAGTAISLKNDGGLALSSARLAVTLLKSDQTI